MGIINNMGLSEGPKIVEHLFFAVTCISIFTCIIRSDYNFAMGLLGYYMIKNAPKNEGIERTAKTLLFLNVLLVGLDILWYFTMKNVWATNPTKNASSWKAFAGIRTFTLILSAINIILKLVAVGF